MEESKRKGKTERVMVHVRVRPFNEDESGRSRETGIETIDSKTGSICVRKEADRKNFIYDSVFDQSSQQDDIYIKVGKPVVESVLQGYNSTILTYGQTGTGKTHTMIGGKGEFRGVIPRAVQHIFDNISSDPSHSYKVTVGFLQIYMEMIQDLLVPDNPKAIRIREDPEEGVYLSGISWIPVSGLKDCMELMNAGDKNRNTAFTHMNSHSSRSHAVYMVKVEKRVRYTREQLEEIENLGNTPDQSVVSSTLHLVDLAGSERVKKSKAVGSRLDEAKNINLSLLTLGNCIQALADKKVKFVPYRDSKLTRLLEDSLGGNSKTSLIVTIGPSKKHIQETISSLQFGSRAMKVENRPEINKQIDYKSLCSQLQSDLDKIHDNNSHFYIREQELLNEISKLKDELKKVVTEKEDLEMLLEDAKNNPLRASSSRDSEEIERSRKNDMKKIQNHYREKLRKQEEEHKKFLEEIDRLMLDQETDLNNMRNDIINLREKNKVLKRDKDNIEKSLNGENKNLREELDRFQGLEDQMSSRDSEINRLNNELEQIIYQRKLQTSETDKLKSENENLKVGYSKQTTDLKTVQDLVMQFEAQVKKMKETQISMHKDFQIKSKAFSHTIKKYKLGIVDSINQFWKVITENMQKLVNKNKELDTQIKSLELSIPKFQDYKLKKAKEVKSLKLEISERLRDVKSSKERIKQLNSNISDLQIRSQQQDSSYSVSYKVSKKSISNLFNSFSQNFNQNITQIYDAVHTQEKKISKIEMITSLIQKYKSEKTKSIAFLSKSLLEKESQLKNNDLKFEKLLTEAYDSRKHTEAGYRQKIETVSCNLQLKEEEISKLIIEKNLLQSNLESNSKSLTKSLNSKSLENATLNDELVKKKKEIDELRSDIRQINRALDENKQLLESKSIDLLTATQEIKKLNQDIKEIQSNNSKLLSQMKQSELKTNENFEIAKKDLTLMYRKSNQFLDHAIQRVYDTLKDNDLKLSKLESLKGEMQLSKKRDSKYISELLIKIQAREAKNQDNEKRYLKMLSDASLLLKKTELELSNRIEELNSIIKSKQDEIQKLESDKSSVVKEFSLSSNSLTDSLKQLNNENHTLKAELSNARSDISQLKTEVSKYKLDLESRNTELENTSYELTNVQNKAKENIEQLNNEVYKYKSDLETTAKNFENTRHELFAVQSKSKEEINQLKNEINMHKRDLDNTIKNLEMTKLELSKLQNQSKAEIDQLKCEISKHQSDLDKTSKELYHKKQELSEIQEQAKSEIAQLQSEIFKYHQDLENTARSLENTKQEQAYMQTKSDSEISQLKNEITMHIKDLENTKHELSNLQKKSELEMAQLMNEILKHKKDLDNASKDLKNTRQDLSTLQNKAEFEITQLDSKISKYQNDLDNKTKDLENAKQELSYVQSKDKLDITQLKTEISNYLTELNDTKADLDNTQQELSRLQTKASSEIAQLNAELSKYQIDLKNTNKDLEGTKVELSDLQTKARSDVTHLSSEISKYKMNLDNTTEELEHTKSEMFNIQKELTDSKDMILRLNHMNLKLKNDLKSNENAFKQSYLVSQNSIKNLIQTFQAEIQRKTSEFDSSIHKLQGKINRLEALKILIQKTISYQAESIKQKDIHLSLTQQKFKKQLADAFTLQKKTETDYKLQLDKSKDMISQKDIEIDRLDKEKKMMENSLDETSRSLNDSLQSKIRENQTLATSLSIAESEFSTLKLDLDQITKTLKQKDQVISQNTAEMKSYTEKIQNLSSMIEQFKRDIIQKEQVISQNTAEMISYTEKIQNLSSMIEQLKRDIIQKEQVISQNTAEMISYTEKIQNLNSLIEQLNSDIIQKDQVISQNTAEIKSYTEKIQNLNSMIEQLNSDIIQKEQSYLNSFRLAKKNISESLAVSTSNLNLQISSYSKHIQELEYKLQSLEASKKLIKKTNSNRSQLFTSLKNLLDKTQANFQASEQIYKQSIAEASLFHKKAEFDFKAETTRLAQILTTKEDEISRLLADKNMMTNNLDSTCRVLNDSLQLQIQQNKNLNIKLEDAQKEITRLNSEVISSTTDLENCCRELETNKENLTRNHERIKELSLVCKNLENSLKINRQTYIQAIKSSKDNLSSLYSDLSKNIQDGMKIMNDKVEGLQVKVNHLEKVKYLIKKKISYKSKLILEKSNIIKYKELELKNTEENYKKLLSDSSSLQQKTEQDYLTKLNLLYTSLSHQQDEIQRLTQEKNLIESNLDNTSKSLNDSLQSKTKENQTLSASLSQAEAEISKLKLDISDFKTASNKASLNITQLEKELNSLREDLKAKNSRISDQNSLNSSLQADIKSKERTFIDSFRLSKRNITHLCESSAKDIQTEMKRVSSSIQILEIKIRKLEAAKDDIHKNSLKKSQIISKLTSSLKDKESKLFNLFSKHKDNYHIIEKLRKDQEEIISNKDIEIRSLKDEISGYLNKIKSYQLDIHNRERELEQLSNQEQSKNQALHELKLEYERKLTEAQSHIDNLSTQYFHKNKETGSEIDSLNKQYQEAVLNHQQVLNSISQTHKKREEDLLSEIEKLSKLFKNKESDYSRLEKKSGSFKSMYDSLKSLVSTLHENLPKIRCRSTSIQSWLLKYLNLKLSQDSSSYHLLTSVLCIYNTITQTKASVTPSTLSQISDMYSFKLTEHSMESTQDSVAGFRKYSDEIYSVMSDMLDLLEAQDVIIHEQTLKSVSNEFPHKRPSIFTGNITDKYKIGKISNLDRLKVPIHNILTRIVSTPESRIESISETVALSTESINSLFDSPTNTDSIKALHEIGETVDNMKTLLLNLGSFINLLGGYSSMLLNSNISLQRSLQNNQNLLSSLFSISNYQAIKLHNKQISLKTYKDRLNYLSQEYTTFRKNIQEETTITLLKDKAARTIQKFWRDKQKQKDSRIALRNFIKAEKESKNLSSMLSSKTGAVIINSSFSELCSIFTQVSFNFLKEDKNLDK